MVRKALAILSGIIAAFFLLGFLGSLIPPRTDSGTIVVVAILAILFGAGTVALWPRTSYPTGTSTSSEAPVLVPTPRPAPASVTTSTTVPPPPAPQQHHPPLAREVKTPPKSPRRPNRSPRTKIREVELTRSRTALPAVDQVFTALDIETTGLDARRDRIVEVAAVKFRGNGELLDELSTLVHNPGSSPEARDVHGIEDDDLEGAPSWQQGWQELALFLSGTYLVAHNLPFEKEFLTRQVSMADVGMPDLPAVCTLASCRRQLKGRAFSLASLHKTVSGGWRSDAHIALGDARATRDLVLWLIDNSPTPLHLTGQPPTSSPTPPVASSQCVTSTRPAPLAAASVAALLRAFPNSPHPRAGNPAAITVYLNALEYALADGRVTYDEARFLSDHGRRTGLTGNQLRALHRQAWLEAFDDASGPWDELEPARRQEMFLAAQALGLDLLAHEINAVITAQAEPSPPPHARYLNGLRLGFAGDSEALTTVRGRALDHGARAAVNITKTVQWLAADDPGDTSRHHARARDLGIPIIDIPEASRRLETDIRAATVLETERREQLERVLAEQERHRTDDDAYWRHHWRRTELPEDPGPGNGW